VRLLEPGPSKPSSALIESAVWSCRPWKRITL
jgi:hypothetical protein